MYTLLKENVYVHFPIYVTKRYVWFLKYVHYSFT